MDAVGTKQEDIAAALRRAAITDTSRPPRVSATHVLQLAGTVLLGVAFVLEPSLVALGVGALGAAGIAFALRRNPVVPEPAVDSHVDPATGLPLTSALPVVVRDPQAMASLTGRIGVLVLDVGAAAELDRAGYPQGAQALMTAIIHRLEAHAWAYPIGGSFGPMFFIEAPFTIVIVRRDVLGDQSNHWLTGRLLDELNAPVPWVNDPLHPRISIGGATGPVADGPTVVSLASLARRDAQAAGPGTVTIRQLDRDRRPPTRPVEVVAADHARPVGLLFEFQDPGSRMGILEHLAGLRTTFARALQATAENGARPLVGTSVIALSHPRAAADLARRASAAGMSSRVGIVLPSDFPSDPEHRAVENVERLRQAGFLVIVDRRDLIDRIRPLPACPVDLVMVGPEFNDLGTGSPVERALLAAAAERGARLAHARTEGRRDAETVAVPAPGSGVPVSAMAGGSNRLNQGGRAAHLAKAGATQGR